MTVERHDLTDQQIAIALQIIEVVKPHKRGDVLTAMVSIMAHAINQADDPDTVAQHWAELLTASVHHARENGDRPYNGGPIQ